MSDPFKTHGAFSWMELMTTDTAAAISFYKDLLGWEFSSMPMPNNENAQYHILSLDEKPLGGIMGFPPNYKGPPCWGAYVTVDDIDAVAEKVKKLGGNIIHPPTDIPTVGRFAVLQDPQGAVFNAITYKFPEKD